MIYCLSFELHTYVGSTTDRLCIRLCKHRDMARKQRSSSLLYKTMFELGPNNFTMTMLQEIEVENKEMLRVIEQEWIDKIKPTLNTIKSRPILNNKQELAKQKQEYYQRNINKWKELWEARDKESYRAMRRTRKQCPICLKDFNGSYLPAHIKKHYNE